MTRDFLTKLIYDNELFHGTVGIGVVMDMNHVEKFAKLVAAEEREKCAKLMDEMNEKDNLSNYYKVAANKIRTKGES